MMNQALSTASEALQTNEAKGAHCVLGAAGNSIRANRARLRFSLSRRRPFWSLGQVRKLGKLRQLYALRGASKFLHAGVHYPFSSVGVHRR